MAANYVQPGKNLDLTAPAAGTTSGVGVLIGRIFSIALKTASAAAAFVGATVGVWSLAKTSAQAWAVGEKIYWDNANNRADNLPTAGFRYIGVCTEIAVNPSSTGKVRLGACVGPLQGDAAPAAASVATAGAATYTAAQILGGVIVRDCTGASRTDVLPTAALLVAAMPGVQVGDIVRCQIINGSDPTTEIITLQEGVGGGWDANQTAVSRTILGTCSKMVTIRITNVTAAAEAYVVYA